jgi:phosphotransferase system enzyme I (PtsI)
MGVAPEGNPYLGLRGVRFCLAHPDVFDTQLRALARVAASGNVRILVPMVGGLDQLRQTRARLKDAAAAVRAKGQTALAEPAIGPMIELPSAVLMGDALAREASFFSIGSNDLIQYTLAVDRGNPGIAQLYDPLDPAVLRAIDMTVRHAHAAGIRVGSCGEMSGELPGLLLLVGLGVDELSVASYLVRRVKAILSQLSARDLTRLAQRCLEAGCPGDVRQSIAEGLGPYPQFRIEAGNGGFRCDWEPKTA